MKKYILSIIALLQFPSHLFFLIWVYLKYFLGIKTKPLSVEWDGFSLEKTFIRWWDGETMVTLGIPMVFVYQYEHSSPRLSEKMKQILAYRGDDIVIGLAREFLSQDESITPHLRAWIITRALFQSDFTQNSQYGDAFFFRQIGSYEKFTQMYQEKKIFLITNQDSIDKIVRDARLPLIGTFTLPKSHAFDSYDILKAWAVEALGRIEDKKDMVIILAGWPMAKVLAYDLTTEYRYVCHDTGQFFDLFLT